MRVICTEKRDSDVVDQARRIPGHDQRCQSDIQAREINFFGVNLF